MTQVLGIIDIVWRGRTIPVEKGATIRLGGIKNTGVTYGRTVGRAGEFQGSEVNATTNLQRGQRATDLFDETEGELQVRCDTGQTFVINDAFLEGDRPVITGGEGGKIPLKWMGGVAEEILA
ncbi:phage tail tube protein [Rhizobium sp. SL86]|uniref:phage tail tube protein n=1 Tax=Rhizobium sp. SL86 TaxID=2995148 RepID=UPI0022768685|nr:phage tail tube protein [Rhizobium sp. SL86]MCY1666243.1 phage tail tube protein [Rhizobium sp. SL86]MCY1667852.1 phage tail tube protein [Rhizobium sp. SL86]MCY1668321.1 phage tail tube protein [Rhizobium sp. SL86]MCY1669340.1 phage tail tube protein [Rhizobium sp. SL86]